MMKLMKFLVVALVAGSVFAPVPSQAEDNKLLLIKCTPDYYDPSFGERPPTMWFTIDLEREAVKSWTHNLEVGDGKHKKWADRERYHSYIDISDRFFEILLKRASANSSATRISIVRMTGEWNYKNSGWPAKVIGRCKNKANPESQRMELHPREFEF